MINTFQTSGTSPTSEAGPDFRCEDHGSIFLLYPLSQSAQSWIEEHLPSDVQWLANAAVVEHRYVSAFLEGILNDGFSVQPS